MSPPLAIALVSLLYFALFAPLMIIVLRPSSAKPLGVAYGVLIAGLASYHSGLFEPATLPPGGVPEVELNGTNCDELLALLDQAHIIIDRRNPPRLVVAGALWTQLPDDARDAVASCVQRSWPSSAPTAQIEVRN
jgi:hypothetical protein